MRKISKSRADDDMVSSTNGSLLKDERADTRVTDIGKDAGSDDDDGINNEVNDDNESDVDYNAKKTPKKAKHKSKGKKRKSGKQKAKEEEYEVEKIMDSKKNKGKLHYLIRWKGYGADSDTWEPENTLSCPELIRIYNDEKENSKTKSKQEKKPAKTGTKRKGKRDASKSASKRPKTEWDDKDADENAEYENSKTKSKQEKKPAKTATKRKGKRDASKSLSKRPKTEWDDKDADENAEYEVDRILEVHHKKNGKREFLIHWKGWSTKFDSWEPEDNLNCPDLIKKFMDKVSAAKTSDSRNLRVAPETTNRFTLQAPTAGRRLSKRCGQRQRVRYDNAE